MVVKVDDRRSHWGTYPFEEFVAMYCDRCREFLVDCPGDSCGGERRNVAFTLLLNQEILHKRQPIILSAHPS